MEWWECSNEFYGYKKKLWEHILTLKAKKNKKVRKLGELAKKILPSWSFSPWNVSSTIKKFKDNKEKWKEKWIDYGSISASFQLLIDVCQDSQLTFTQLT